jgi:hypothetical protein
MARGRAVRVRIEDFEDGVLPLVCASTGAPADARYGVRATGPSPGWVWLFLLGGPIGWLLAFGLAGTVRSSSTLGMVPFTDAHQDALQARIRRLAWTTVGGVALLVAGLALGGTSGEAFSPLALLFVAVGFALALVAGFLWLHPPGSVKATIEGNGRWVVLTPVAAAFVEGYEAQEARRRQARRLEADDLQSR